MNRTCEGCGTPLEHKRADARYCTGKCANLYRRRNERKALRVMQRADIRNASSCVEAIARAQHLLEGALDA